MCRNTLLLPPPLTADLELLPAVTDDRFPGRPNMALLAAPSKSPIVLVILVMATGTAGDQLQFHQYRSLVTIGTLEILVLALQLETGLVVAEVPVFPVARVVAGFAIGTQSALVHILLFMARPAVRLGIFVSGSRVAFLALNEQMLSRKRIARLYVIEYGFFPGLLTVASFTLLSFLPLVLVILLVT